MGGHRDRERKRARARAAVQRWVKHTCPRCGANDAHFVPPGMGDPGFFICDVDPAVIQCVRVTE